MTTRWTRRVLKTDSRTGLLALAGALALIVSLTMSLLSSPATAAVLGQNDNVAICHANEGVKGWVSNAPNVDSIVKASGHDSHSDDIIPSFDYDLGKGAGVQHYPGKNLGLVSVLNNGCNVPTGVRALAPTVVQSQCVNSVGTVPAYTINAVTGVVYSVGGNPVTGTNNGVAGTSITVVASAASAAFSLAGTTSFPITFAATPTPCGQTTTTTTTTTTTGNPTTGTSTTGTSTTGTSTTGSGSTGAGQTPDGNLGVSKAGPGTAHPGDDLAWIIVVSNTSGAAATGFSVTDSLAPGLSFTSAEGDGFDCTHVVSDITCTYTLALPVGASVSFEVRAALDDSFQPDVLTNSAVLTPGRPDTNSGDNTSTAVTSVTAEPAVVTGGGGGAASGPTPAKPTAPKPAASGGGGGGGGGGVLPFTGSHAGQLVQTGAAMLLLGWYFVTVGRRRPVHAR